MSSVDGTISVLHVDDEPSLTEMVATFLEREEDGFVIETASSASDGLDRLTDTAFDCIISDYDMPGRNGIEFLESVRKEYPDLPFILYTGKGSEEVASDAISSGATDYLQKETGTGQYAVLANRIQNAVAQHRSQRRADEHQRITGVIRNLNRALAHAGSVDEIEQEVCAILSDADPYLTACIAGVNTDTMQIEPRTWTGDDAGYFDALEMSVAEDEPGRHAPGGRAYHEREIAVSQHIAEDPQYEQWRNAATERGFRSLAVVPLEYSDDLYGLLAVFADRRYTFDEAEQNLLTELGDDIAHAMQACKAKSALRVRSRAMDEAPVGITITDPDKPDNPMTYINDEFTAVSGYARDDVRGENHRFLQGPDTADEPVAAMRAAIDNEERVTVELRNYRKHGEQFWNRVSIAPVYDDDGHLTNYVGFQEDITDQKESEQELRQSEERFEAMFNDPHILVGVLDIDGTVQDINDTALEYTDARLADVQGQKVWTTPWFSEERHPFIKENVDQAATGEYVTYETELTTLDGGPYSVTGVIRPVTDDGGKVVSLILSTRDVTERKKREARLRGLNETTHRLITADSREAISEIGVEAARDVLELAANSIHLYDEDQEALVPIETTDTLSDLIGDIPTFTGGDSIAWRVYEQGEALLLSEMNENPDVYNPETIIKSELYLPLGEYGILIAGSDTQEAFDQQDRVFGEILALLITAALEQVTQTDRLRAREQELARKNERLEQFADVVSHDLRNPLQVAEGRLELVSQECDSDHVAAIGRAHERMKILIDDLLTLARNGDKVSERDSIDFGNFVNNCWQTVDTAAATLAIEIEQGIRADSSRLKQLLENLIRNAVEHGGDDVVVTVGALENGFYVEDDGPGIGDDKRDKVFDAGYSTNNEGTGFGLSIVSQVTDDHGWTIRVTDSSDGGARFEITGVEFTR